LVGCHVAGATLLWVMVIRLLLVSDMRALKAD